MALSGDQIRRIEQWLMNIVCILQSLPKNQQLQEKIGDWCNMRKDTIRTVEECIASVESWHNGMTYLGEIGGTVLAGISGTVTTVSEVLVAFNYISLETSRRIGNWARGTGISGNAISAGTTIIKPLIERHKANNAVKRLNDDLEKSVELTEFLRSSEELKRIINEILDVDIFCRLTRGFRSLCEEGRNETVLWSPMSSSVPLPDDIVQMITSLPSTIQQKVEDIFLVIHRQQHVRNVIKILNTFNGHQPLVFPSTFLLAEIYRILSRIPGPPIELLSSNVTVQTISLAARTGNHLMRRRSDDGDLLPSLSILTIDCINLLTTKTEIDEDVSAILTQLRSYVRHMERELTQVEDLKERLSAVTSD